LQSSTPVSTFSTPTSQAGRSYPDPSCRASRSRTGTGTAPTPSGRLAEPSVPRSFPATAWPPMPRSTRAKCSPTQEGAATPVFWPNQLGHREQLQGGVHVAGAATRPGDAPSLIYEAVARRALRAGTLIIAAAGNESDRASGNQSCGAPGELPVDHGRRGPGLQPAGHVLLQPRYQPERGNVDIAGPGLDVYSSWPMPTRYRRLPVPAWRRRTSRASQPCWPKPIQRPRHPRSGAVSSHRPAAAPVLCGRGSGPRSGTVAIASPSGRPRRGSLPGDGPGAKPQTACGMLKGKTRQARRAAPVVRSYAHKRGAGSCRGYAGGISCAGGRDNVVGRSAPD